MKKVMIIAFALTVAGPAFAQSSSGTGGGTGASSGNGISQGTGTSSGMNNNGAGMSGRTNSGLPGGHPGDDLNKPANGDHGNNGSNGG